jgi:hypothetical protein
MSDIAINPANGNLTAKIVVTTAQVVGFEIVIYDSDGNTELAHYLSDSQANNPYLCQLPQPAGYYQNKYVSAIFSIIDPIGAGNNYNINFSIQQLNADLQPVQNLNGTTVTGKLNRYAIFHIQ